MLQPVLFPVSVIKLVRSCDNVHDFILLALECLPFLLAK